MSKETEKILLARVRHDFTYHAPDEAKVKLHEEVRAKLRNAALFIVKKCPEGRERALAITHLEQSMFYANAAIARSEE